MVDKKVQSTLDKMAEGAHHAKVMHRDDWSNSITGLGDYGRDKRYGAVPFVTSLSYEDVTDLYRASKTAQIAVDEFANEMTREWCDVVIDDDEELSESVGNELERLKSEVKIHKMIQWQRQYGGSALLVGVNDGQSDFSKPIDTANLQSIDFLTEFDPSECRVIEWNASPADPEYGEPLFYSIFPRIFGMGSATILQKVHSSRVIRLNGPLANRWQVAIRAGWGDSIFDSTWTRIRDFDATHDASASLIQDWGQGVFSLEGLADAMANDQEGKVAARIKMIDYSRSVLRAIALDKEETFTRESTPATGLPDLIDRIAKYLAMQLDMPASVLMGQPAGAMGGDNGDNEIGLWHAKLAAKQTRELSPVLLKLVRLILLCKKGPNKGAKLPEGYSIKWRPLGKPSDKESAETNYQQAQADSLNIQSGLVSPDEVRVSRWKGGKFSTQTQIDESMDTVNGEGAEAQAGGENNAVGQPALAGTQLAGAKAGVPPSTPDKVASAKDDSTTKPGNKKNGITESITAAPPLQGAQTGSDPSKRSVLSAPQAKAAPAPKAGDQGMAGHQVSAAHELVKSAATGQIPADAVLTMLIHMLGMDPNAAQSIIDSLEGFKPQPDPMKQQELDIKATAAKKGLNDKTNKTAKPKAKPGKA